MYAPTWPAAAPHSHILSSGASGVLLVSPAQAMGANMVVAGAVKGAGQAMGAMNAVSTPLLPPLYFPFCRWPVSAVSANSANSANSALYANSPSSPSPPLTKCDRPPPLAAHESDTCHADSAELSKGIGKDGHGSEPPLLEYPMRGVVAYGMSWGGRVSSKRRWGMRWTTVWMGRVSMESRMI